MVAIFFFSIPSHLNRSDWSSYDPVRFWSNKVSKYRGPWWQLSWFCIYWIPCRGYNENEVYNLVSRWGARIENSCPLFSERIENVFLYRARSHQPLKTGSIYSLSRIDTLSLCKISHLGVKICSTKHLHARRTFLPRESHLIHTKLDFKINFAFICTA